MDNPDKIFEKIKNASLQQEAQDFPSMDKVWSRVESKLDNKVLKKENKLWKKIAIAASFLLVFTVSYHVFKPAKAIIIPPNTTATNDSIKTISPTIIKKQEAITIAHEPNPIIKRNAAKILETQISNSSESVAVSDAIPSAPQAEMISAQTTKIEESNAAKEKDDEDKKMKSTNSRKGQTFETRSVIRESESKKQASDKADISAPLLVIDGTAVTSKDEKQTLKQGLSGLDPNEIKEIVVLNEPLYIINGNYYSEQELFGPNPTSPYHPLNQQEIESLTVLQGEKAIAVYGKKGAKGVVIITTKNGKPVKTSKRTEP